MYVAHGRPEQCRVDVGLSDVYYCAGIQTILTRLCIWINSTHLTVNPAFRAPDVTCTDKMVRVNDGWRLSMVDGIVAILQRSSNLDPDSYGFCRDPMVSSEL